MNIQLKKLKLIEWIAQISDTDVISKMDKIRKSYISKTKDDVKPMSLAEFYTGIEEAEKDIKSGRVHSHDEVEKESENW
jgi:hypothetical protein